MVISEKFFSYSGYKEFLQYAKNFKIIRLKDFDGEKAVILRHDIDFDVEAAYKLALIEHELGIRASYFFLVTCYTYNLFSYINRNYVQKIKEMGHEIGLHFDPTVYSYNSFDELKNYVDKEAQILSFLIDEKVESISLHNPSVYNSFPLFDGYKNAYDPLIFGDDKYISDSSMDFRGKNIYEFIKKSEIHVVQVLLHPFHFTEEGYTNYNQIFSKILRRKISIIHEYFKASRKYAKEVNDLFESLCK
ncbi:MAG: hypothetical protein RMJ36_06975 [Candidatus Calescibacterium sp.]|nr:hypothetical protein [Candidatus Calescibacterium sp.]MDW8133379.1 hypothetical protein [Candidatus Calescibacterium sp.]